ncbi:MAG: hypothetical protein IPK16_32305 [Anaerolineales bacterium]|nr:hypothetical protein [Anaerolineales bacterium]
MLQAEAEARGKEAAIGQGDGLQLSVGAHPIGDIVGALACDRNRCGPRIVEAAAWHDIRKGDPNHGVAGAKEAKKILERTDFPAEKIPVVVDAIAQHVGLYRPPEATPLEPLEAAVLWDADKLSKLGAQALAASMGMDTMVGLNLDQRRRTILEFTQGVLARTVESMNTLPARELAETRYREMAIFLEAWEREEELERRDS